MASFSVFRKDADFWERVTMASAAVLGSLGLGGVLKALIDRRKRRDELDLEESQSVIEAMRTEIQALRAERTADRQEHRNEIERFERKLAESQAEIQRLSAAVLSLQTAALDDHSEKQHLQFQLQQRDAQLTERERTIEQLTLANTAANSRCLELETKYAQANGRVQMLTQEVNRLRELKR